MSKTFIDTNIIIYANDAVNALGKLKQALPVVMHQLHLLKSLEAVVIKPVLVRRALEILGIYGIGY